MAEESTSRKAPFPTFVALELTYACNHSCVFCSNVWKIPGKKYPMGTVLNGREWCEFISRFSHLGTTSFVLTGGEPTVHPEFLHILRHLLRTEWFDYIRLLPVPVDVSIITNGDTDVLVNAGDELLEEFAANPRNSVSVSLHGDEARHKEVTGGSLEKTLKTITKLIEKKIQVFANVVIGGGMPGKTPTQSAVEAAEIAIGAGCKNIVLMRPMATGKGSSEDAASFIKVSKEQIQDAVRAIRRLVAPVGGTVTLACCTPVCVLPDSDPTGDLEDAVDVVVPRACGCGKDTICIDPSGYVRPCTTSEVISGSALLLGEDKSVAGDDNKDPAVIAVRAEPMQEFVKNAQSGEKPEVCKTCKHKDNCSAGCPSAHTDCANGGRADPLVS